MLLSERKLVVLCVACSVLGVVALFIIASVAEPLQVSPSVAAKLDVRSGNSPMIRVVGFVDSVSITESRAVVKIAELETVEAVSFDAIYIKGLGLKRFQEVEVFGELKEYVTFFLATFTLEFAITINQKRENDFQKVNGNQLNVHTKR